MKIRLDLIKDSPRPVRTSWDEDKMNELAQSIREQGVIVPVKVRLHDLSNRCTGPYGERTCIEVRDYALERWGPEGAHTEPLCPWCHYTAYGEHWEPIDVSESDPVPDGWKPYELVYGHRRVEAARRAGLDEIPAIVEGVDDTDALIQALIENVQREDLQPIEEGNAYSVTIGYTGWSQRELSERTGIHLMRINRHLALLQETPSVQNLVKRSGSSVKNGVTEGHVREVRAALGEDRETKERVVKKASKEGLTMKQTRCVAEAVRDAPDEETKKALLDTPVEKDTDIWEAAARIAASDKKSKRKKKHLMAPAVKEFLEDLRRTQRIFERGKDMMRLGKMGPEHAPYIAKKLRQFAEWLNDWADELDKFREELVDE